MDEAQGGGMGKANEFLRPDEQQIMSHCDDPFRSELDLFALRLVEARKGWIISDCWACHGTGHFTDSESGGMEVVCHCWQNAVLKQRGRAEAAERELAELREQERMVYQMVCCPSDGTAEQVIDRLRDLLPTPPVQEATK